MRFELDETCEAIVHAAAAVLDGSLGPLDGSGSLLDGSLGPLNGVRRPLDGQGSDDPDLAERTWKALGQSGLLSLSVPTRLGGEGLGVLASMVMLTEVGRRGAVLPALATLALGVLPVVRWGTPDQQDELLTGMPVLTGAVRPSTIACSPDLVLSGTAIGVPYADHARRILLPVTLVEGGTAVALVDPDATGVALTRTHSSSGTPEWTVRLDSASAAGLLGGGSAAVADLQRLALAGACAVGDGALAGALALTSAYVGSREQFGRRLATFQAVAQQIADVYIASRTLHLATLSACWRLSDGLDAQTDLDVATFWLAREAPVALRTCHHLHGGLGLDVTYPLHRYSALVKDLVRLVGGADQHLDALASRDVH